MSTLSTALPTTGQLAALGHSAARHLTSYGECRIVTTASNHCQCASIAIILLFYVASSEMFPSALSVTLEEGRANLCEYALDVVTFNVNQMFSVFTFSI